MSTDKKSPHESYSPADAPGSSRANSCRGSAMACRAALASLMLGDRSLRAAPVPGDAADLPPHLPVKARRAIHICLCGAMSHVDTFDYKPELVRLHGKSLSTDEKPDVFFGQVGLLRAPDWQFRQTPAKAACGSATCCRISRKWPTS